MSKSKAWEPSASSAFVSGAGCQARLVQPGCSRDARAQRVLPALRGGDDPLRRLADEVDDEGLRQPGSTPSNRPARKVRLRAPGQRGRDAGHCHDLRLNRLGVTVG